MAPNLPIDPKHIALAKRWIPSAGFYGASATLMVFFVTEFKTVLQYVPLYNLKYREK